MDALFAALVFAAGAAVGSFLNVVIYRVPVGASVVRPASRCPQCETPIRWWHNVPILGWCVLRGRCAACKVEISARYPLIELAMGLLAMAVFIDLSGGGLSALVSRADGVHVALDVMAPVVLYATFVAGLIAVAFIDLDWFIVPDGLSLGGIVLGFITSYAVGGSIGVTWQSSAAGAALGAGIILVVIFGYGWLTGRAGMGGGDWKLLAAIGAYLGAPAIPAVLLLGSVQGLLWAVVFRRAFAVEELPADPGVPSDLMAPPAAPVSSDARAGGGTSFRHLAIPFGPFLALAAVEVFFFREPLRVLFRL